MDVRSLACLTDERREPQPAGKEHLSLRTHGPGSRGRLGSKMDVTGGAGGGICPASFLPLLLLLKRPARWRDLALAHLGTDVRARLAGMLDSPPQRCDRNNVQTVGSAGRSRKLPGGGVSGQQGKKGAAEERQKNWVLVQSPGAHQWTPSPLWGRSAQRREAHRQLLEK
ncbi:uncharacterized protein LOC117067205 isoform X4 [Trachypithecus francoisi]|uniref:uncharacterized protein LOC117067205 isoform X4 n=1 Tax=Trachypithecus francoisi TaxID=54180 RepID=UPI00141A6F66|nr:uncharacterized protein LOC117067205 isoform X4 [Trachypithecus francoisi]